MPLHAESKEKCREDGDVLERGDLRGGSCWIL